VGGVDEQHVGRLELLDAGQRCLLGGDRRDLGCIGRGHAAASVERIRIEDLVGRVVAVLAVSLERAGNEPARVAGPELDDPGRSLPANHRVQHL
jgi:hypothetical protein